MSLRARPARPTLAQAGALGMLAWTLAASAAGTGQQPRATPVQVPDTLAQRTIACTACHGKEGRATNQGWFPRIAGKPAGYLYHQLQNFRAGRRTNAAMTYLVDHLSDAYLQEIAGYFASLDLPYPPPLPPSASAAELQYGSALVHDGDGTRRIPACVGCHGAALTGAQPSVPGLLGLPRDYLIAQLGNWQTGLRRAASPDCMADVARNLEARDIAAIASWLASQPLPADTHAAASLPADAPMKCGSFAP